MSKARKDKGKEGDQGDTVDHWVDIEGSHDQLPTDGPSKDRRNHWGFSLKRKAKKSKEYEESRRSSNSSCRGSRNYERSPTNKAQMGKPALDGLQDEKNSINGKIYTHEVDTGPSSYGNSSEFPKEDPPLYNHHHQSSRPLTMSMGMNENYEGLSSIQTPGRGVSTYFYNRLNRKRTMPIANSMGTRGFYVFASEHSYDMFKNGGFKRAQLNPEGVGIPLLQMVESYDVVAWFSKRRPIYLIYKFTVQNIDDPPPYSHSKLVLKEGQFCVYKVPFCEIYRQISYLTTTYRFHFPLQSENLNDYHLTDSYDYKSYGTSVDGFEMTWEGSLEASLNMWGYDLRLNSTSDKVLATYTTKDSDYLPKKTFKCANLYVMEESNPDALGNSSICWLTQVLACQGALLHRLMRDGL